MSHDGTVSSRVPHAIAIFTNALLPMTMYKAPLWIRLRIHVYEVNTRQILHAKGVSPLIT